MPQQKIDNEFEKLMQELGVDYRRSAKEKKALQKARKIKTAEQLMRMVLLYSGVDESLREVAGNMALLGIAMTDQSVMERLANCPAWLQDVVSKMLELPAKFVSKLKERKRLLIADMTDVTSPGAKGSEWRVHLVIDAARLELTDIKIMDCHKTESLQLVDVKEGDLVLGDRAYCRRDKIFATIDKGADVALRYNQKSVPVYDSEGNKIDLTKHLRQQERESYSTSAVTIDCKDGRKKQVWLHAYRLSKEEAALAKKRCQRNNRKVKGRISDLTLFLSGFVVVLTNLSPLQICAEVMLELYRGRWQVELAIKRFKSLLNLDKLRVRRSAALAQVWLYGKMLYVLILEAVARKRCGSAYQFQHSRQQTPWRLLKLLCHPINAALTACQHWSELNWRLALRLLAERKRKRNLQALPADVVKFLGKPKRQAKAA